MNRDTGKIVNLICLSRIDIVLIRILIGVFLVGIHIESVNAQDDEVPPEYRTPGKKGILVQSSMPPAVLTYDVLDPSPGTLSCDQTRIVRWGAEISPVSCDDSLRGHYKTLYDEASEMRKGLNRDVCPDRCPILNARIVMHKGECQPVPERPWDRAQVTLRVILECRSEDQPLQKGLQIPNPIPNHAFEESQSETDLVSPVDESCFTRLNVFRDESIMAGDDPEACPSRYPVEGRVHQEVASCSAISDYRSFIKRARQRTLLLWENAHCRFPCTKQRPPDELGSSWDCEERSDHPNDLVKARVQFDVSCQQ